MKNFHNVTSSKKMLAHGLRGMGAFGKHRARIRLETSTASSKKQDNGERTKGK